MARGSIRQRGDSFQVRVYTGFVDGRRRYVTRTVHGSQRDAETALARLVVEVESGQTAPPSRGTVAAFLDEWFDAFSADWTLSTRAFTQGAIGRYLRPHLGDTRLTKLETADIDRLYGRMRRAGVEGHPLSPGYIGRVHDVLHAALEQAVAWDRIPSNPAGRARPPRINIRELRPPSPLEVRKLLQAAGGEFAVCLRCLAATGARRGEVCGLQWPDIDLDGAEITFRRRIVVGGRQLEIRPLTKNRKTRKVSLDPGTVTVLRAHQLAMKERALACGTKLVKDAFVFSDEPAGRAPWRPDSAVTGRFMKLRDELGIDVRLHDLRHAAATQLLVAGVDVRTAAERLGHDPRTMLGIYAHPVREADQRAANIVGGLLDDEAG
jgi:integrase